MTHQNAPALSAAVIIIGHQQLQNSLLCTLLSNSGLRCAAAATLGVPADIADTATLLFLVDAATLKPVDALDDIDELPIAEQTVRIAFFNLDAADEDVDALAAHPAMSGIFPRDCPQDQLLKGVQAILHGEVWLPRKILEQYMAKNRTYKRPGVNAAALLTEREAEVLRVMATGAKNTDIAQHMNLSPHTIKTHIYNIFKKINASNRLQAVNWANQNL